MIGVRICNGPGHWLDCGVEIDPRNPPQMLTLNVNKALVAVAVATALLPDHATAQAQNPAPQSPPPDGREPNRSPTSLGAIKVEGGPDEAAPRSKAESRTTSSKLDLTLRETPQSVSVITLESLKLRQVQDFGQALEPSAGVTQFSGTGPFGGQPGFGFNETTIRGISIDSLNDVREDSFINSTYFAIPDMAIYDRIEVIKGPNSVVYGRGSAGGLINRIRKKPLAESQAEVELSVGSFDSYRADVDLTGPLNSSGNVRGRLVGAYKDEGSFVDGGNDSHPARAQPRRGFHAHHAPAARRSLPARQLHSEPWYAAGHRGRHPLPVRRT